MFSPFRSSYYKPRSQSVVVKDEHLTETRRAIHDALFEPFINSVIVKLIQEGEGLSDWARSVYRPGPTLITAYPGVGKSHQVVDVAEMLAVGSEHFTIFFGLSHESFNNIPTRIEWARWQPHAKACTSHQRATKGYPTEWDDCDCDADRSRSAKRPTFAAVEHALADSPNVVPLTQETLNFPLWIFDEVSMDRFIDTMVVTAEDLEKTVALHPTPLVKTLAESLHVLLAEHKELNEGRIKYKAENWRGVEFYQKLSESLLSLGYTYPDFMGRVPLVIEQLGDFNWYRFKQASDLPQNFAPRLLRIMMVELSHFIAGRPFNPCIHIVKDSPKGREPTESLIRIRRRKYVPHCMPSVVLDATADPDLLERVFGRTKPAHIGDPPAIPQDVQVRQLLNHTLGVSSLRSKNDQNKYCKLLQEEVRRYWAEFDDGYPLRVGIITFMEKVDLFKGALEEIGIPDERIVIGHYYNLRGKNDFIKPESCDVLAIIGFPRPNLEALYEEACALFDDDDEPICRQQMEYDEALKLRNGNCLTIWGLDGYQDSRLEKLFRQKSRSELYQAFHRSRAYLEGGIGKILVFTDVPIPHVVVDGFIGTHGDMFSALDSLIQSRGEATVADVADLVMRNKPTLTIKRESLITRIKRDAQGKNGLTGWLCEATGTIYTPGKSGVPGVFTRCPGSQSEEHILPALSHA